MGVAFYVSASLFVCLWSAVCYTNSISGDLVHDDIFAIVDNEDVRPSSSLQGLFFNDFWGMSMSSNMSHKSYRPLCVLTFRMNYWLHQLEPWGYHFVNVLLHSLVSVAVLEFCLRQVFGELRSALLTSLLFAAHPVHTEAVSGVVGRADVLSLLLFIAALASYIRCIDCSVSAEAVEEDLVLFPATNSVLLLVVTAVCGSAAMLSKETGITVFGVCVVYDVLIACRKGLERVWTMKDLSVLLQYGRPLIYRTVFLSFVVLLLLVFRLRMLHGHVPSFTDQENPASFAEHLSTRGLTYSYLYAFNMWLLLAPVTLSYDWALGSIPLVESIADVRNLATLIFLISLALLTYHCLMLKLICHARVMTMGLALLVIPFLPASNLFFKVGFVVAERVLYIPSLGFCILIVYGANCLCEIFQRKQIIKQLVFAVLCLLIFFFSWRTIARNIVWHDRESLFKYGLKPVPMNAKVHYNYGNYLKDVGRKQEAAERFRTAIQLYPRHASACNNLGTLVDDDAEAEIWYRKALEISPNHARAHFNLGNLKNKQGKKDEAERLLRESIRLDPNYIDAWLNFASLLDDNERFDEAFSAMEKAIELKPDRADTYNNMGAHLTKIGKQKESLPYYDKALSLNPTLTIAMVNKARVLRSLGESKEAEQYYKRALTLERSADTLHYLGSMYYNTERFADAERAFRESLEIDSNRAETRQNYAMTLVQLGRRNEAIQFLQEVLQSDPQNTAIRTHLSLLLASSKQLQEALQVLNGADESKSEVWFAKGNILKDLNQLDDAAEAYLRTVSLDARHAGARMNLGGIYHLQRKFPEAREQYEMALRLDPDNEILQSNLQKLNREKQKSNQYTAGR